MIQIERIVSDADDAEPVVVGEVVGNSVRVNRVKSTDYDKQYREWQIDDALLNVVLPMSHEDVLFVEVIESESKTVFKIPIDVALKVGVEKQHERFGKTICVGVDYFSIAGKPPKIKVESGRINEIKRQKAERAALVVADHEELRESKICKIDGVVLDNDDDLSMGE